MNGTMFFAWFALTVVMTRMFLWVRPTPSPTVGGWRLHHWMFGLAGIIVALALRSPVLGAISLGLFVDELAYLLIGGKTHEDNYSRRSIIGTALLVVVCFFVRSQLAAFF